MSRRRRKKPRSAHLQAMGAGPTRVRIEVNALLAQAQQDLHAGRLEQAKRLCEVILTQQPENFDAWMLCSLLADSQGETQLMVDCLRRVLALRPGHYGAALNLSAYLWRNHLPAESVAVLEPALAANPTKVRLWNNYGNALRDLDRHEDAMVAYDRMLAVEPGQAEGRFNRALTLLILGQDGEGWREYDARWETTQYASEWARAHLWQPRWDGEAGGRVCVWAEQGSGDVIQMLRYLPMVVARSGQRGVLEVQPELKRLCWLQFRDCCDVVARGENVGPYDYHLPIMSLPAVLGASPPPPFTVRAEDGDAWPLQGPELKVGFVWAGNRSHPNDAWRSTELAHWAPIVGLPRTRWFSLQIGARTEELEPWADGGLVTDCAPVIRDFADTANVIASLDLVVTVDTATAHLAGAMGKETWMLVAANPDYRWRRAGTTTAWYPSMTLWRQETLGDWRGVMHRIRAALRRRLNLEEDAA